MSAISVRRCGSTDVGKSIRARGTARILYRSCCGADRSISRQWFVSPEILRRSEARPAVVRRHVRENATDNADNSPLATNNHHPRRHDANVASLLPIATTKTATPTALPTWRAVFSTALPVVARWAGNALAAANIGAWTSPAAQPISNSPGRNPLTYAGAAVAPKSQQAAAAGRQSDPNTAGAVRPNRAAIGPALTAHSSATSGPGAMAKPVRRAL